MTETILTGRRLPETIRRFVLDSGLTVLWYPMPGYRAVHAVYATRFGSCDRQFLLNGQRVETPAGIAHFLEHKMFENEDGQDAFALYAQTGASANAFTSFERTCYIFTATEKTSESLDILLSFVSKPYFTDATVAKEQGIIGQEIRMYEDNWSWKALFGILDCLYWHHPVKDDIAGSAESIGAITPDLLYGCTNAFYDPHNMVLSVAGNLSDAELFDGLAKAGLTEPRQRPAVERICPEEPAEIHCKEKIFQMPIARPALTLGFKQNPLFQDRLRGEICAELALEMLIGDTSPLFRELYDQGLINSDFGGEYLSGAGYFCLLLSGETKDPAQVEKRILEEIERLRQQGIDRELFEATRNAMYGEGVFQFDSVDDIATEAADCELKGHTVFDQLEIIVDVTAEEVEALLHQGFAEEQMARVLVLPGEVVND